MLAESMTIPEIALELQQARFEEVLVTIPEGFRAEEIAERLAENFVIDSERFLTAVRQPQSLGLLDAYDFLSNLPQGASLEGYLFPDTYRFPVNASGPELVLVSMLDNFANRVGAEGLSGGTSGMNDHDLVTLASIVEREAVQDDERPLIASVYLNRLNNTCRDVGGTYLQADPTVQYCQGHHRRLVVEAADHPGIRPGRQPLQHLSASRATARSYRQPGPASHRSHQ